MNPSAEVLNIEELNIITRKQKTEIATQAFSETLSETVSLWEKLLNTVHHPATSDKHMTASCNAVCFVIRSAVRSQNRDVRHFAGSKRAWDDAFAVSRSAFASGKHKPALQVLDTLLHLAQSGPNPDTVKHSVFEAACDMAKLIISQRPKKSLKEACIVLYFFLRRLSDFMRFPDVLQQAYSDTKLTFLRRCHAFGITASPPAHPTDQCWFAFILSLLMIVNVAESTSATLKLLSLLCSLPVKDSSADVVNIVHQAIDCYGTTNEVSADALSKDVLPSILTSKEQFHAFLLKSRSVEVNKKSTIQLVLAQLQFGKSRGYVSEQKIPILINTKLFRGIHDDQLDSEDSYAGCRKLLRNASPAIRQSCFELLTFSSSPKALPSLALLKCLAGSLLYLHDDLDAYYRGELFSTWRRFLTRLRQCHSVLSKQSLDIADGGQWEVDHFIEKYFTFLTAELDPSVSYSRHILALDLLCFILETFEPFNDDFLQITFTNTTLQKSLFRLVLDPYDDIRSASARSLLHLTNLNQASGSFNSQPFLIISKPLEMAQTLAASTNRADHADALGRLIGLFYTVKVNDTKPVNCSSGNDEMFKLAREVQQQLKLITKFDPSSLYPLHGNILGLSYMVRTQKPIAISTTNSLLKDVLLTICSRIWILTQGHLCVDSPEVEDDSIDESTFSGPKDLLAYAWRALRDSNLLMQSMIESVDADHLLIATIGDLCLDQLKHLRHRGAFSTVAQTFLLCCQGASIGDRNKFTQLTSAWFSKAIVELEHQAGKLTRRSAGLPAIFAALLDSSDRSRFSTSFEALLTIAVQNDQSSLLHNSHDRQHLPQVHALNCIKDIMTNSRFRNMTEPLVFLTINLAAQSMESPVWAIKNCGLMLLRASINRLDPDTGAGAAEAGYSMHRNLVGSETPLDIGLRLLNSSSVLGVTGNESSHAQPKSQQLVSSTAEAEFAGLDLLSRLYISEDEHRKVQQVVRQKLSHKLWHIRAQAARLFSKLAIEGNEVSVIKEMVYGLDENSADESHGKLLTVKNLLEKMQHNIDTREYVTDIAEILSQLLESSQLLERPLHAAEVIEITNSLAILSADEAACTDRMYDVLGVSMQNLLARELSPNALLNRAYATYLVQTCSINAPCRVEQAISLLEKDEDTAAAVLFRFQSPETSQIGAHGVDIALRILQSASSQDIQALAMVAMISISYHHQRALSMAELQHLAKQVKWGQHVSRSLMVAQLKMYSFLCVQSWHIKAQDIIYELKKNATSFRLYLRMAASDTYDDLTRRGASEALSELTRWSHVDQVVDSIFGNSGRFELMSLLYDLLNDDDEEIRNFSAELVIHFSGTSTMEDNALESLSAAASREILRKHMLLDFCVSESLVLECLRRLLDIETILLLSDPKTAIQNHLEQIPVRDQLNSVLTRANDLFAEEKQNLYVDDASEIKVWAQLMCSAEAKLEPYLIAMAKTWVAQGLTSFAAFYTESQNNVQIAYNVDIELLSIRVITIARVIGGCETELQDLQCKCNDLDASASMLSAFTWSLR